MSLTETPSGLLVPESALPEPPPPSSVVNAYGIVFPSKETAEKFVDHCIVRWQYFLGVMNIAAEDKPESWRAAARKGSGVTHDTRIPGYVAQEGDNKLSSFVDIKKHNDKAFTIVNKY